jgi:hypothetical protein
MKGNCTKLKRWNGTGWDLIGKRTSITGPALTRETVEQELTLDCTPGGGSATKKKSPGTKEIGDIELEVLWNAALPSGVAQVETATGVGTVTAPGSALVTITAAGMPGSPLVLNVPVTNGVPSHWMQEVRNFVSTSPQVAARFNVGGAGAMLVLTALDHAANDATLNIAIATGTATGITAAASSADTTAGVDGQENPQNHHLFAEDFEKETATHWMIEYPNSAQSGIIVHATVKELGAPEATPNSDVKRSFTLEPTGEFYRHANDITAEVLPVDVPAPEDNWGRD